MSALLALILTNIMQPVGFRPLQRGPAHEDGVTASVLPATAADTAEAQPSAASIPAGAPGDTADKDTLTAATGAAEPPPAGDSSSEAISDDSAAEEHANDTAAVELNGRAGRVQNGHNHSGQQAATEQAQQSGRPPDATQEDADGAADVEQHSGPKSDSPAGVDPYLENEPDPAKARALESSLWEIDSLRNHYCLQASCQ